MKDLLKLNENGLYCEVGGFYIDPWNPVDKAVITHGHSDHSRWGHKYYLATDESEYIIRHRLGSDILLQTLKYDEIINIDGVKVSFHPAGHILGSAQIRVEYKGQIWVVSGDYKTTLDSTCRQFEPVKCHTFITESTFALPIYKWENDKIIFEQINSWWKKNASQGITSILFSYALGKAQRILKGIDSNIGPIYVHGAVQNMNECYRKTGVELPKTKYISNSKSRTDFENAIVIAPLSASNPAWLKKYKKVSTAFASGWMIVRGNRRRRAADVGFVMSDHADWDELLWAIKSTEAERVITTHGNSEVFAKYLRELGYESSSLETKFTGETEESEAE